MRKLEYDFVKGIAIICVVLLHSISYEDLYIIYAPWHIWQAIPIFVIISGALLAESLKKKSKTNFLKIKTSIIKLLKPALIIWMLQLLLVYVVKNDIDERRLLELVKQGGFGSGGYFIYIAIQNIIFGGIYYLIIKKYRLHGLFLIACFSVLVDGFAYYTNMDEELYRIMATRYALFYSIGIVYVTGLLDSHRKMIILLFLGGLIWLGVIQKYMFNYQPIYPSWHAHTALSGFIAYFLFLRLVAFYKNNLNNSVVRLVCHLGHFSYYIFLVQMSFFWFKRYAIFNNFYPKYGWHIIFGELLICLVVGLLYAKFYNSYFQESRFTKN